MIDENQLSIYCYRMINYHKRNNKSLILQKKLKKDVDYLELMRFLYRIGGKDIKENNWFCMFNLFYMKMQLLTNTIKILTSLFQNNIIYDYQLPSPSSEELWLNYKLDVFFQSLAIHNNNHEYVINTFLKKCKKSYLALNNQSVCFNYLRIQSILILTERVKDFESSLNSKKIKNEQ